MSILQLDGNLTSKHRWNMKEGRIRWNLKISLDRMFFCYFPVYCVLLIVYLTSAFPLFYVYLLTCRQVLARVSFAEAGGWHFVDGCLCNFFAVLQQFCVWRPDFPIDLLFARRPIQDLILVVWTVMGENERISLFSA